MHATRRLFSIIQFLRSARAPVRAQYLAEELEVSVRTIYRDIAELQTQGVPICGEAGVGYILEDDYHLPPLMLTPDELEAALLGAQWVAKNGDSGLASGARSLLAKLHSAVPEELQGILAKEALVVPVQEQVPDHRIDLALLRQSIHQRQKLRIQYLDLKQQTSERTIWPFMLAYFENKRLLCAWCESRNDFRHFRTDRIQSCEPIQQRFPKTVQQLRALWWQKERKRGLKFQ